METGLFTDISLISGSVLYPDSQVSENVAKYTHGKMHLK